MSDESQPLDQERDIPPKPGALLSQAREERGLTLEGVAFELRLTPSVIQNLESDDPKLSTSKTFLRGYFRAYARLVGVCPQQVIESYEYHFESDGYPESTVSALASPSMSAKHWQMPNWQSFTRANVMLSGGILVACVLTVLTVWYFPFGESQPPSAANVAALEDASPLETRVDSVESLAKAARGILDLQFKEECWVTVFDATHARLITGIQSPEAPLRLEGTPPFQVMLGNAKAASLRFNGRQVDLTTVEDAQGVANLTLG